MIKQIISGLCFLALSFLTAPVFADSAPITESERIEVENFFNSYIDSANNYRDDLVDKYKEDAKIIRVVIKPNGNKVPVVIPTKRYFDELKFGQKTARLVNYKNKYTNKEYLKTGENQYKILATRTPRQDKEGLNAEFTVIKTPDGLKIAEESMETTVQKFLKAK